MAGAIAWVCFFFVWTANPVHGVLTLVAVGLGFAAAMLRLGLEFVALVVVLVYIGAVAVLFIFVVMMVNLRATPSSYPTAESTGVWAAAAGVLLFSALPPPGEVPFSLAAGPLLEGRSNLSGLGFLLYGTDRVYGVILVGLVLFVSLVSAICLSLVGGENYRTQEVYSQVRRSNSVFKFRTTF